MIGYVKTEDDHGRCFHCNGILPDHHEPTCTWTTACTNPAHGDLCPLLAHKLKQTPGTCFNLGDVAQFPWRYKYDDWTFMLLAVEAGIGKVYEKCTPCGHQHGGVVGKRKAGCILVRCTTCGFEGIYHLPGCNRICAPLGW